MMASLTESAEDEDDELELLADWFDAHPIRANKQRAVNRANARFRCLIADSFPRGFKRRCFYGRHVITVRIISLVRLVVVYLAVLNGAFKKAMSMSP